MKIVTKIKLIFTLSTIALVQLSCFKSEQFPVEPVIADAEVEVYGDSLAIVSFSFTDGDADIGLAPSDTTGDYAWGSYFYYNIYLTPMVKDDVLGWRQEEDINGDPFSWPYRIKPISVSENTEGIKGTMDIEVNQWRGPEMDESDTLKFEIILIDRALNISNIIETPEIISE